MLGAIITFFTLVTVISIVFFGINDDVSATILCILCVAILAFLLVKLPSLKVYDPMVVLLGSYFVLILVGTWVFELIKGRSYDSTASVLVYGGFVSMFCGVLLSRYKLLVVETKSFPHLPSVLAGAKSKILILLLSFIGLLGFFALVLQGGIPILASDVDTARLNFFSGKGYLNSFFMVLPIVAVAFLFDSYSSGSRRRVQYVHLFAILVTALNFLTGFRTAPLKAALLYLLSYLLVTKTRVSLYKLLAMFALLLLFLVLVGAFRRGSIDIEYLVMETGITVVARPAMLEIILNRFDLANLLHGSGYFADFIKLLPGSQVGQNVELKYQMFPYADNMPALAGVTPSIIGEAYMNFGRVGTLFIPFVVGFSLGRLYKLCIGNPNNFFVVILYVSLLLESVVALVAGIGTLLPTYLVTLFWIIIVSTLYKKRIKLA